MSKGHMFLCPLPVALPPLDADARVPLNRQPDSGDVCVDDVGAHPGVDEAWRVGNLPGII